MIAVFDLSRILERDRRVHVQFPAVVRDQWTQAPFELLGNHTFEAPVAVHDLVPI